MIWIIAMRFLHLKIDTLSKTEITGYRHSKAWATNQQLFFNIQFSRPFNFVALYEDGTDQKGVKAAFEFNSVESNILEIKIGISAVDEEGAKPPSRISSQPII